MASKRARRRKLQAHMCGHKIQYLSKEVAQEANVYYHKKFGYWKHPYRCRFCRLWHLGSVNKEVA